jgi:tRNA A-37 threonylcarbamoyl transferase component Bud32
MSQLVELNCGTMRWQIDPEFVRGDAQGVASGLFRADGPPVEEWVQAGRATAVKDGPHQSVFHVVLPGFDFYLKQYHLANARAWLRGLLRRAKAKLEFERTRLVAERGLPTLTPLAAGETVAVGPTRSSYLVTRTLPDSVPLNRFLESMLPTLEPLRRTRLRQRIAVALGQLLARTHHAGVTYHDLHPGNLLMKLDADDRVQLYLIDVYAVTFGPPLSSRQSRANLIVLNRWFMLRAQRSDRLRFWHAYRESRRSLESGRASPHWWERLLAPLRFGTRPQPAGAAVRALEHGTLASNLQFWRNLDRRCLRTNRHFKCVRRGDVVGHVVADVEPQLLGRLLDDPDEPFRKPGVSRLKDSKSSTVIELSPAAPATGKTLILKRFAVTNWGDPWAALVRRTPALRSFVQGHGLALRLLPTPRPVAVLHRQRNGLRREGYLLTEKVEDAVDLHAFLKRLEDAGPAGCRATLRPLIAQVARLVCTLHQRRLSHRDLKAANLLVQTDAGSGSLKVWFIDLVGVVRHRQLRRGRRVANLARLHASFHTHPLITRTDKLRFLRVYLRWGLRGKLGWKTWWRQIERATRAKIARNLRNRRPLG